MLSLMTLNVEGVKHHDRVLPFIEAKAPMILCLQEVTESLLVMLRARGYLTTFMPMTGKPFGVIGVAIASRLTFTATTRYYHQSGTRVPLYNHTRKAATEWLGYLATTITRNDETYTIITTHFWDTRNGKPDTMQRTLMPKLLSELNQEPAHVLCGDFNIPRHHNELYKTLTEHYTDTIPQDYQSSLDRSLHRLRNAALDQPIFDAYMVDYIFTKPPYVANNTQLHFGVSDHAAVTTELSIRQ